MAEGSVISRDTVTTVSMADAAHTLVIGAAAGSAQTRITGRVLFVDPASSGGTEDLTLPAEADFIGWLLICNAADAAEAVVVKTDGGGTVITLDQTQAGIVACDGTTWRGFMGDIT